MDYQNILDALQWFFISFIGMRVYRIGKKVEK